MTRFTIMTFNAFLAVAYPLKRYGQTTRSHHMIPTLQRYLQEYQVDVLVFQELVAYEKQFATAMKEIGFSYMSNPLVASSFKHAVDSGVLVFSRWPIARQTASHFTHCSGTDCLAGKGIVYTMIEKEQQAFHVFSTHLQAWKTAVAADTRRQQYHEAQAFAQAQNIPPAEALFWAGDFNVDRYMQAEEFRYICRTLQVTLPPLTETSPRFSVDADRNELVGWDDPSSYATSQFPKGCLPEMVEQRQCVCCPSEWIDFVLVSQIHRQPVQAHTDIIQAKSPTPFDMYVDGHLRSHARDVSDHFPVVGSFEYEVQGSPVKSCRTSQPLDMSTKTTMSAWSQALLVVTAAVAIALVWYFFLHRNFYLEKIYHEKAIRTSQ